MLTAWGKRAAGGWLERPCWGTQVRVRSKYQRCASAEISFFSSFFAKKKVVPIVDGQGRDLARDQYVRRTR